MKKLLLLSVFISMVFYSCSVKYSFTGASISPAVKTVSVLYFDNQAPIVQASLSQTFTEGLRDKFVSQTNLEMVNEGGDLNFEGAITGYATKPMGVQGNETASLNRLTITVKVKFSNEKDDTQDYEKTFSAYSDYDSSRSLDEVEEGLIEEIVQQLTEDVFNEAVANW